MQKIKASLTNWLVSEKGRDILTVIIIILVGSASFGLGRLSNRSQGELKIEYTEPPMPAVLGTQAIIEEVVKPAPNPIKVVLPKVYFASSRGNKYYHLGCSGGKTLKEENKIYFNSAEEAERAGYELSSSCKKSR